MPLLHDRSSHPRITIAYHSAAGGTRVVAELLAELLSTHNNIKVIDIYNSEAVAALHGSDFTLLCYPTYFLKPSMSMQEFISRLKPVNRPHPVYLVTTYEFYTENSLRICALLLKDKGMTVLGSAAIRAPGSDITCIVPEGLCSWLYRFQSDLPQKLLSIACEVQTLARNGGRERLPWLKWYTPLAQVLQRSLLNHFIECRKYIRILPTRCSQCGLCVSLCFRGAWVKEDDRLRHDPARCELCTRCIHHCPRQAIILSRLLKDNKRLNTPHYTRLKARARRALVSSGAVSGST